MPLFAEKTEVRANRIDVQNIDKTERKVILIEMSCPWFNKRAVKTDEKTRKYGPLRSELKKKYPSYNSHSITSMYKVGTRKKRESPYKV